MYADFFQYYSLDLVECLKPYATFSPRRALLLIRNLPDDSATSASVRGGQHFKGWGMDRYFLAALVNAVRQNTHAVISANSKKKPQEPDLIQFPEHQKKQTNNQFAAMAGARIAAVRKARGGE